MFVTVFAAAEIKIQSHNFLKYFEGGLGVSLRPPPWVLKYKGPGREKGTKLQLIYTAVARRQTSAQGPAAAPLKDSIHRAVCLISSTLGYWTTPAIKS